MTLQRAVVVGAGVSGLAAARALRRAAPGAEVLLLERARRPGGLVETEHTPDGYVLEHGADCLLTTKPAGVRTVYELGLGDALVPGTAPRRSYVVRHGRLVPLPAIFAGPDARTAAALLATRLLSSRGKLRLVLEPLVRRAAPADDESVAAFLSARFGGELVDGIVEPFVAGVYGGEAGTLSAAACLPRLRELERRYGSVTLGLRRAIAERRRRAASETVLPPVMTLRPGMESLVAGLAAEMHSVLRLGVDVQRIERGAHAAFRVLTGAGAIDCDAVVLAVPAWAAPPLVERLAPDLASGLAAIPHKAFDAVSMAWRRADVPHALRGTGFVRGAGERRMTTACTWASVKWPGRAPADRVLVRSMLVPSPAAEPELIGVARRDLRDLLGVTAAPIFVRVRRQPCGTPVYGVGHPARVARLRENAAALGPLALAGNALGGIGIPDCIESGERAAALVVAG